MSATTLTAPNHGLATASSRSVQDFGRRRILFLVTEDWYFASHRLEFAAKVRDANYSVAVGCRLSGMERSIRQHGIEVFHLDFSRESLSMRRAVREICAIRQLIHDYQPDVVHLVALRPILLGALAGVRHRKAVFVNAITGLGSMFTGELHSFRLRLVQKAMLLLMRPAFGNQNRYNVFQNAEDMRAFINRGFARAERSFLIRGAGVLPESWSPRSEPSHGLPVLLYVGRLLKDKGLAELVEASCRLRANGVAHILRIVGDRDECSPKSFSRHEIEEWVKTGTLEWLGRRPDVLEQMSQANVVILPSYREGLPKVLLEAGLARRAVVTCDVVGCREIVEHQRNGLLVPPRNPAALAVEIEELLKSPALRSRLAHAHHEIVCRDFSLDRVTQQFLDLYDIALNGVKNPALG